MQKFKTEFQNYVDNLSEADLTSSNIKTVLSEKADELENSLSTAKMKLSCEVESVEVHNAGEEIDIVSKNYELLKEKYGKEYGWSTMTEDEIQRDWRDNKKSDVMLRICHDMIQGELDEFVLPPHIQHIIDFMQGDVVEECR